MGPTSLGHSRRIWFSLINHYHLQIICHLPVTHINSTLYTCISLVVFFVHKKQLRYVLFFVGVKILHVVLIQNLIMENRPAIRRNVWSVDLWLRGLLHVEYRSFLADSPGELLQKLRIWRFAWKKNHGWTLWLPIDLCKALCT